MMWTAPPRHESAIEVGAVRTSHDSEEPGHANDYDRWSRYRQVGFSDSRHRCGWQCCCSPSAQAALCSDVLSEAATVSGRHRGLCVIALLVARTTGLQPHFTPDGRQIKGPGLRPGLRHFAADRGPIINPYWLLFASLLFIRVFAAGQQLGVDS